LRYLQGFMMTEITLRPKLVIANSATLNAQHFGESGKELFDLEFR